MIKQSCLSVAACLLFLAIFLLPNHAVAQAPARFSEAPNEFVDQLGQFMTVSKRPDLEESYSVFKKLYKTGAFSDDNLKHIILVSNVLRDQKLTPYPYFKNYLNALSAARVDADTTLFRRWHNFAEAVLIDVEKGKVKPIGQFLEFSADFMEQRALKVGEGGSVTWKIKKGSFDFDYHDRVPVVTFKDVDLIGARKVDSTTVRKTSGRFLPFDGIWQGQGGRVSWSEAGLDSSIYAELTRYKVEAVKPLFQCDSAMMYYPLYFKEGIPGKFENNVIVRSRSASARPDSLQDFQFPRFESFAKVLKITKIGAGIEYVGGFKLAGNALYGYGSGSEPAQVRIYNKKREQVFYGRGPLFIIKRGESIVAEGVDARLYMDQDSLYHPAADLRVDIPKQVITLSKGDKGSERNPFFSSFYNMNLNTDRIAWHLNYDSLEIGARIGTVKGIEQKVRFESSNHFNPAEYHKMQMISDKNPISTLYTLWRKSNQDAGNGRLVSDNAFAQELNPRFDYSSIQTLLAEMVVPRRFDSLQETIAPMSVMLLLVILYSVTLRTWLIEKPVRLVGGGLEALFALPARVLS